MKVFSVVVLLLCLCLTPAPVRAETTDGASWTHPEPAAVVAVPVVPIEHVCDDREELAGVTQAEAYSQPLQAQIAIMQIVKREADSRGLTICALTRQTKFVSVRLFANANPNSWTAEQFRHPQTIFLELADAVLLDQLEDATAGNMHFDGDWGRGCAMQIGQTCFRP